MSEKSAASLGDYLTDLVSASTKPDIKLLRQAATQKLAADSPMPTRKSEHWRYTSLRSLLAADLRAPEPKDSTPPTSHETGGVALEVRDGFWRYSPDLPAGVRTAAPLTDDQAMLQSLLDTQGSSYPFNTLNLAGLTDVLVLSIDASRQVPLSLRYTASSPDLAQHTLLVIRLGPGASCRLIEKDEAAGYLNSRLWVQQSEESVLCHQRVQCHNPSGWQMSILDVHLATGARYELVQASLGSELRRNDITVTLHGRGASADLQGLYSSTGKQQVDNHCSVIHAEAGGQSDVCFHGLAFDKGRATFDGRIVIEKHADQTAAALQNRNLLLSDNAEINAKPTLEIYASDVKCSHGVTVGQLDERALFYLCSRGIALLAAEFLLTQGFAANILNKLHTEADRRLWLQALTTATHPD